MTKGSFFPSFQFTMITIAQLMIIFFFFFPLCGKSCTTRERGEREKRESRENEGKMKDSRGSHFLPCDNQSFFLLFLLSFFLPLYFFLSFSFFFPTNHQHHHIRCRTSFPCPGNKNVKKNGLFLSLSFFPSVKVLLFVFSQSFLK